MLYILTSREKQKYIPSLLETKLKPLTYIHIYIYNSIANSTHPFHTDIFIVHAVKDNRTLKHLNVEVVFSLNLQYQSVTSDIIQSYAKHTE